MPSSSQSETVVRSQEACEEESKRENENTSSEENVKERKKINKNHVTETTTSKESFNEKKSKLSVEPDIAERPVSEIKDFDKPVADKLSETEPEKIWIVDTPAIAAWDEEVDDLDKPVYEYIDCWWIRFDDERGIVRYYDKEEWKIVRSSDPHARQNGNENEKHLTGYKKKTIHHPAVDEAGHWEYR